MKITVCQLHNGREAFAADWERLVAHVGAQRSDLVLLPEMPFFPWFPTPREFDAGVWRAAVAAHDTWEKRLSELLPAVVFGTRPIDFGALRYSAGFFWNAEEGIAETLHVKSCLSHQEGSWETSWYSKAIADFKTATVGGIQVGMLIGLELWLSNQAQLYGEDGAQLVVVPRVDQAAVQESAATNEEWLAGGRAAALASGAFCISSTRSSRDNSVVGAGWILAPDGRTLALTSSNEPFVAVEVDLSQVRTRPK